MSPCSSDYILTEKILERPFRSMVLRSRRVVVGGGDYFSSAMTEITLRDF